jgi:hypothetical protein
MSYDPATEDYWNNLANNVQDGGGDWTQTWSPAQPQFQDNQNPWQPPAQPDYTSPAGGWDDWTEPAPQPSFDWNNLFSSVGQDMNSWASQQPPAPLTSPLDNPFNSSAVGAGFGLGPNDQLPGGPYYGDTQISYGNQSILDSPLVPSFSYDPNAPLEDYQDPQTLYKKYYNQTTGQPTYQSPQQQLDISTQDYWNSLNATSQEPAQTQQKPQTAQDYAKQILNPWGQWAQQEARLTPEQQKQQQIKSIIDRAGNGVNAALQNTAAADIPIVSGLANWTENTSQAFGKPLQNLQNRTGNPIDAILDASTGLFSGTLGALGEATKPIGGAVDWAAKSNLPGISQGGQGVQGYWQNVVEPVTQGTLSAAGDLLKPTDIAVRSVFERDKVTQELQQQKIAYEQQIHDQALQSGYSEDQAMQMVKDFDAKNTSFSQYAGQMAPGIIVDPIRGVVDRDNMTQELTQRKHDAVMQTYNDTLAAGGNQDQANAAALARQQDLTMGNLYELPGMEKFQSLPPALQAAIMLGDPFSNASGNFLMAGKLPEAAAATRLGKTIERGASYVTPLGAAEKVAGGIADQAPVISNLFKKAGEKLESPAQKADAFATGADQLQSTLETYAQASGENYHDVETRFATDPDFRARLNYTGKDAQLGDDLAQAISENSAEGLAQSYKLGEKGEDIPTPKAEENPIGLPDLATGRELKANDMAAQEWDSTPVATKADLYRQELQSQLEETYNQRPELNGDPDQARALAAHDANETTKVLDTPKKLANFEERNPDIVQPVQEERQAAALQRITGKKEYTPEALAGEARAGRELSDAGINGLDRVREQVKDTTRPEYVKSLKVKGYEGLEPAERTALLKQNLRLKVGADKLDEFGKVRPARQLDEFGKVGGAIARGPNTSGVMARLYLNSPGRLIKDPAGNVVKSLVEGYKLGVSRKAAARMDELGIARPTGESLAGGISKDVGEAAKPSAAKTGAGKAGLTAGHVAKEGAFLLANWPGELFNKVLLSPVSKTKLGKKLGIEETINAQVERAEGGVKAGVYNQVAVKTFEKVAAQKTRELLQDPQLASAAPELSKLITDGKVTPEQIEQFAAGQLAAGDFKKLASGEYHLQNYSPDVVDLGSKLDGTLFEPVKDVFDKLPPNARPGSYEWTRAVQEAKQTANTAYISSVKDEAATIRKAKVDPATNNAIQFPSFSKKILEEKQAGRESYYSAFQDYDVFAQRQLQEAVRLENYKPTASELSTITPRQAIAAKIREMEDVTSGTSLKVSHINDLADAIVRNDKAAFQRTYEAIQNDARYQSQINRKYQNVDIYGKLEQKLETSKEYFERMAGDQAAIREARNDLAKSQARAKLEKGPTQEERLRTYAREIFNPVDSTIVTPTALRTMFRRFGQVSREQRARYFQDFLNTDEHIRNVTGNTFKLDPQNMDVVRIADGKALRHGKLADQPAQSIQSRPAPEKLIDTAQRRELMKLSEQIFGAGSDHALQMQEALNKIEARLGDLAHKNFADMHPAERDLATTIVSREAGFPDPNDPAVMYGQLTEQRQAAMDYIQKLGEDASTRATDAAKAKRVAKAQSEDVQKATDQLVQRIAEARASARLEAQRAGKKEVDRIYFNYQAKNRLDQIANQWLPFQYWARQNAVYAIKHFASHPMHLMALLNFMNAVEEQNQREGIPEYLRGNIFLWRNADGSRTQLNMNAFNPFNPFGDSDNFMNFITTVSPDQVDKSPTVNKSPLALVFGADRPGGGRDMGIFGQFIRPNPIIEDTSKLGVISDLYKALGVVDKNGNLFGNKDLQVGTSFGSPGAKSQQTLGLFPSTIITKDIAASTGADKWLRQQGVKITDLDMEGPLNEGLFGRNAGKPLTKINQEITRKVAAGELTKEQALKAMASIKSGNYNGDALAILDQIDAEDTPRKLLSMIGFTLVLSNSTREQATNKLSQEYRDVKGQAGHYEDQTDPATGKTKKVYIPGAQDNFFSNNPAASVMFSGNNTAEEINQSLANDKTSKAVSDLYAQREGGQLTTRQFNTAMDKIHTDNPDYFSAQAGKDFLQMAGLAPLKQGEKQLTPDEWKAKYISNQGQRQYSETLDDFYRQTNSDRYNELTQKAKELSAAGNAKSARDVYNTQEYKDLTAKRKSFMSLNPDFAQQYKENNAAKYGTPIKSEGDQSYDDQLSQFYNIGGDKFQQLQDAYQAAKDRGDKKTANAIYGSQNYQRVLQAREQFKADNPDFGDRYKSEYEAKYGKQSNIASTSKSYSTGTSSKTYYAPAKKPTTTYYKPAAKSSSSNYSTQGKTPYSPSSSTYKKPAAAGTNNAWRYATKFNTFDELLQSMGLGNQGSANPAYKKPAAAKYYKPKAPVAKKPTAPKAKTYYPKTAKAKPAYSYPKY